MDIVYMGVGLLVGCGAGLICRRNQLKLIPSYYDMDLGVIGKKQYYENLEK